MGACFATRRRIAAQEEFITAQDMQIQELEGRLVHLEEVNQFLLRDLTIANKNFRKATVENVQLKWLNSRIELYCNTLEKRCDCRI